VRGSLAERARQRSNRVTPATPGSSPPADPRVALRRTVEHEAIMPVDHAVQRPPSPHSSRRPSAAAGCARLASLAVLAGPTPGPPCRRALSSRRRPARPRPRPRGSGPHSAQRSASPPVRRRAPVTTRPPRYARRPPGIVNSGHRGGACAWGRAARACRPASWRCRRCRTAGYGRGSVMPCRHGSPWVSANATAGSRVPGNPPTPPAESPENPPSGRTPARKPLQMVARGVQP
jgi:hypothetical protein